MGNSLVSGTPPPPMIDGSVVQFVHEAEHVGVLSSSDNMLNILQRIEPTRRLLEVSALLAWPDPTGGILLLP